MIYVSFYHEHNISGAVLLSIKTAYRIGATALLKLRRLESGIAGKRDQLSLSYLPHFLHIIQKQIEGGKKPQKTKALLQMEVSCSVNSNGSIN